MPDFERILRQIEYLSAESDDERRCIVEFYKGVDHARWQIVKVVLIGAIIWSTIILLFNPYGL